MRSSARIRVLAALSCLMVAVLSAQAAPTVELGHTIGLRHEHTRPESAGVLNIHALISDGGVAQAEGIYLDAAGLKTLVCLEAQPSRNGELILYASFAPVTQSLRPSQFVQVRVLDGVATRAELGISDERTSADRCGAAFTKVNSVDAITVRQTAVED